MHAEQIYELLCGCIF